MTNRKTARVIERFLSGESSSKIRYDEHINYEQLNNALSKYLPGPPDVLQFEFLYDSRMNDETVRNFVSEE